MTFFRYDLSCNRGYLMCITDETHIYFKVHIRLVFMNLQGNLAEHWELEESHGTFLQYICCFKGMYIHSCIQTDVFHWNKPFFEKTELYDIWGQNAILQRIWHFLAHQTCLSQRGRTICGYYTNFFPRSPTSIDARTWVTSPWRGGHTCWKPLSWNRSLVSQGKQVPTLTCA